MKKAVAPDSIKQRLKTAVCCCALALCCGEVVPAAAETTNINDFGSETVEGTSPTTALPVDQVEEKAAPAPARQAQPLPPAVPNNTPPSEGSGKEPGLPTGDLGPGASAMTTVLNVKDADITALVATMSKLTNRNYVVDNTVKGKVTIHQPTPVSIAEALRIFESVLLLKGFTTVPIGDNVWKVVPAKDARQTTIPTSTDSPKSSSDALITQLIRLKNVPASDMQQVLAQFVSREGMINSFAGTNSLIVIDSAANIKRLTKLIEQMDVPATDQDITIIPVLHADSKDIADKINEILGQKEGEAGKQQGNPQIRTIATPPPMPGIPGQPESSAGGKNIGTRSLPLKVIPDERTNSLIVIADAALTAKVQALVEQLDSPVDLSGGRFHVYRLKHADAEKLSDILGGLISGTGGSTSQKSTKASTGSSLSRNRSSDQSSMFGGSTRSRSFRDRMSDTNRGLQGQSPGQNTSAVSGTSMTVHGGEKVNFEGEVSIAPDTSTNSLIINALKSDYERLREVIEELDQQRPQVLVEATILEVSLTKDEGLGVELQGTIGGDNGGILGQTNWGGLTNLLTNPAALSDLTVAAASTGTLTLPGGLVIPSQAVLISALSKNTNVNVLSAPTVLATDNEEAEIIVGQNVPFVTSTSRNDVNLNNSFNQIERQDVGITLRITPQISAGDFVILKIFVEISSVVNGTLNDPNGPTTTIRTTETTVEVKNSQMVVTGGLIADTVSDSQRGVPFLQDIPVLGNLFKRNDEHQDRTNLLVFITPKVIKDNYDAREQTKLASGRMKEVIAEQETEPDRHEVLESENMDRVAESIPPPNPLPTTITPPSNNQLSAAETPESKAAFARTQERLKALASQSAAESSTAAKASEPVTATPEPDDTINLVVHPKLPPIPGGEPRGKTAASAPQASISGQTFVVLRDLGPATKGGRGGLAYADDFGTVGLVVKGSAESSAGKFFAPGKQYLYQLGADKHRFVCLGVFGSLEDAAKVYPVLASTRTWIKLTSQESSALGDNSWLRI